MNVQTERLEDHIARLTVGIEMARLEKAKKQAARKLARRVSIPGFRKGKAPYRVLVSYVGEAPILEEAIETLGNDIFRNALEESGVEPYSMGQLEDFKLDPEPVFTFTVPMQPTVEMNDYTSVRVDYEEPEVEDDDVDEALRRLQEEHAVVEESANPAAMGDKVTLDVSGNYVDLENTEDVEDAEDEDHDHDDEDEHDHSAPIHQHDAEIYLDEEREPLPGFAEAVVGITPDESREFELTYPEDEEKYGEFAGKVVRFHVSAKKVENVTLPALNDEFAARVSEEDDDFEGDEPLTLLELRARLRENIASSVEQSYRSEYIEKVMDELVSVAEFAYPDAMIENQVERMVEQTAQQFGLQVDDYVRLLGKDIEELYEDESYRESAERYVERSLVMRGILDAETIEIDESEIEAEIDRFVAQFGDQGSQFRGLFDTPEMRDNMTNNLLEDKIRDRIVQIGRGIEPEIESSTDEPVSESDEAADAVEPETDEARESPETE